MSICLNSSAAVFGEYPTGYPGVGCSVHTLLPPCLASEIPVGNRAGTTILPLKNAVSGQDM